MRKILSFAIGIIILVIIFAFYKDYSASRPPKDLITKEEVKFTEEQQKEFEDKTNKEQEIIKDETKGAQERFKAWLNLGVNKETMGDFMGALEAYEEAHKLFSDQMTPFLNIGNLKRRMRDFKGAEEAIREVIKMYPAERDAYFRLAELYEQYPGKPKNEVIKIYQDMLERFGDEFEIVFRYAEFMELKVESLPEALALYELAHKLNPEAKEVPEIIKEIKNKITRNR